MEAVIPRPGDRVPKPIRYDLIIIGGGPAGLTAAVYASLLGMQALLISPNLGGQTVKGSKSKNNVGYEFISGGELIFRFQDQLLQHDYLKHRIAEVKTVQHCGDHLKVQAKRGGEQYEATALIITTGMRRRFFGVPGEQRVAGVQVKNQESGEEQYFPVGGKSGTLKNWYSGNPKPYIHAKSGTLGNNYNLSGYLVTNSGKILIFSYMNNHYLHSNNAIKEKMQTTFEWLRDNY